MRDGTVLRVIFGGTVSRTTVVEALPVFHAASVAVAVMVFVPSERLIFAV